MAKAIIMTYEQDLNATAGVLYHATPKKVAQEAQKLGYRHPMQTSALKDLQREINSQRQGLNVRGLTGRE